jgi:hypothetical protein
MIQFYRFLYAAVNFISPFQTLRPLSHLPPRVMGLVIEWATIHQKELFADWERARAQQEMQKIAHLNSGQPTWHSSRSAQFRVVLSAELGRYQDFRQLLLLLEDLGI